MISQLAYNAWVTSSKKALKDLKKEKKEIKKKEKKRNEREQREKERQEQQGETIQEFALCPLTTGLNSTEWREQ